jgi:four helix bundle protein
LVLAIIFGRFLEIALGSTFELESQVVLCEKINLFKRENTESLLQLINEEQRMLTVFIKKLKTNA